MSKATSIDQIETQMRGEAPPVHEQEYFPDVPKDTATTAEIPVSEYVIFKLINKRGRGNINIDGVCDAFNPESGKVERMRLLSGIASPWLKDQEKITKDYVDMNRRSLKFEDGILRIPIWDETAIAYAKHHNSFVENKKRKTGSKFEFFEWNPQRIAEERLKQRHFKVDAMKKAMEVPFEEMRKHALYLGVPAVDEMGLPKTEDSFRNDYILKAEENPSRFMETFGDKIVEISYMVKRAIMDAKIDFGKERNKAYFSTGKFICSIPPNRKPQEVLLELATSSTPEAQVFLDDLNRAVK